MKERILYEDKEILVCHKPAGIATQSGKVGQKDMVSEIKNYLNKASACGKTPCRAENSHRGSIPYLGLVHRLDQPVEGLLVFAKTPFAARELGRQLTEQTLHKEYLAAALGKGFTEEGSLEDYLIRDNKTNTSRIAGKGEAGAKIAKLQARTVFFDPQDQISILKIRLLTGRHHQIRVQLANAGLPLLGDNKYGTESSRKKSKELGIDNIALCACRLEFKHPGTKKKLEFEIKPEGKIFRNDTGRWESPWKN